MMHSASISCLAFNEDGKMLASGSRDGRIKVWSILSGKCLKKFNHAHSEAVKRLVFSKSGSQVLSCSSDATIR